MVLAANAPDLDVVCWFGGSESYIHWHRNITHSLLALPVMAMIAVALVRWIGRKPVDWLRAWLIALVAVASHLILDLTNVYGVRLLLPFSGHWTHWDITPVIELTIWGILLLGVAAPALARLVGSEIGEQRKGAGNAGWAVTALVMLLAWDTGRAWFHDEALERVKTATYNGFAPRQSAAYPTANPLVWTGTVELSNAWVQAPVDLRNSFHPAANDTWYKAERTPAVDAALQSSPFQTFLTFVQAPIWVTEPAADVSGGTLVRLIDLRFGNPQRAGFATSALVDASNRVLDAHFGFGPLRPR
jgi:inner membrane protein